jgi:hypothetical protein
MFNMVDMKTAFCALVPHSEQSFYQYIKFIWINSDY